MPDDAPVEDILYDFYFAEADEDKGEEAVILFKYNESATGIPNCWRRILTIWTGA